MPASVDPRPLCRWSVPAAFGLATLLLHLPFLGRYGFHPDELYFLACGRHLAFGYVDHAPLVPWVARLAETVFGPSLVSLRIFAAVAGAIGVLLTGVLSRQLGGGPFAQAVACLAAMVAPVYLRTGNTFHIPSFEFPLWALGFYLLARIFHDDNQKLWLPLGVAAGIGLLNKHSMLLFGFGLMTGLLLTAQRRHLLSPWLYAGGAIAALLLLPNLLWQVAHDWPTVEFLRNENHTKMGQIRAVDFLVGQVLYLHPLAAPIWLAGLVFFFSDRGKPYRPLGWIYLSILALLLLIKGKIYYLAPAYSALFAGGAVVFEELRRRRPWVGPATLGALALGGAVLLPTSLPILSVDATEHYVRAVTFGVLGDVYEMTHDLRFMFGWPERVQAVADVYQKLPEAERGRTAILAGWYGLAGAIDYFGPRHGLPPAVSGNMTYYLWGLPPHPIDTVIAVDFPPDRLHEFFSEVAVASEVRLENVDPSDRDFRVLVARKPKKDFHTVWPQLRDYSN